MNYPLCINNTTELVATRVEEIEAMSRQRLPPTRPIQTEVFGFLERNPCWLDLYLDYCEAREEAELAEMEASPPSSSAAPLKKKKTIADSVATYVLSDTDEDDM